MQRAFPMFLGRIIIVLKYSFSIFECLLRHKFIYEHPTEEHFIYLFIFSLPPSFPKIEVLRKNYVMPYSYPPKNTCRLLSNLPLSQEHISNLTN